MTLWDILIDVFKLKKHYLVNYTIYFNDEQSTQNISNCMVTLRGKVDENLITKITKEIREHRGITEEEGTILISTIQRML